MQAAEIKPGVVGAFRGGGILLSCQRQNLLHRERYVSSFEALDDRQGKTVPARRA